LCFSKKSRLYKLKTEDDHYFDFLQKIKMKIITSLLQAALLAWLSSPIAVAHEAGGVSSTNAVAGSAYSGFRGLSWVTPIVTDDDDSTAAADDATTSSTSSSSTLSLSPQGAGAGDDDTTTRSTTSSKTSSTTTDDDYSTTTDDDDDSIDTVASTNNNSTHTTEKSAKNATKPPAMFPEVDEITDLYDDDVVNGNGNITALLPPETEQPESWPVIVTGIFLAATVTLLGGTYYKMYFRKRSKYTTVPSIDV
jgi:hypothetical protein